MYSVNCMLGKVLVHSQPPAQALKINGHELT